MTTYTLIQQRFTLPTTHASSNNTTTTNKSTGITHQIRIKLNFNDEKIWKLFSSRRLELIDSMHLSEKKASEQDLEILNCSKILMNEFNYKDEIYTLDFIKLVQVAIQSVRRNRKRSIKSKDHNKSTTKFRRSKLNKFVKVKQMSTPKSDDYDDDDDDDDEEEEDLYSSSNDDDSSFKMTDIINTDDNNNNISSIVQPYNIQQQQQQKNIYNSSSTNTFSSPEMYSSRLVPLNSLLQPVLPKSSSLSSSSSHHHQLRNTYVNSTKLPSFASLLLEDSDFGMMINSQSQKDQMILDQIFSERELELLNKLLALIKKSKTCNDLSLDLMRNTHNNKVTSSSSSSSSSSNYENLEVLGSTIILSTISYIFEKFFINLNPSSISYLRLKLNNDSTLTKILRNLDMSLSDYYNNDFISAQTFKKLIGCCIKDFGFDTIIAPLTDIIHEIILKDYPLISKNSLSQQTMLNTTTRLTMPSPTASIITTASTFTLNHHNQNHDHTHHQQQQQHNNNNTHDIISVELRFQSNVLHLKFNNRTSSMPTFLEILENCKDAFDTRCQYVYLRNLRTSILIQNDEDVRKLFQELFETDGLVIVGVFGSSPSPPTSSSSPVALDLRPIPKQQQQQQQQQTTVAANATTTAPLPPLIPLMPSTTTTTTTKKRDSLLDTLSNAAEMVEFRSNNNHTDNKNNTHINNDNSFSSSPPIARDSMMMTIPMKKDEKIVFQPLL